MKIPTYKIPAYEYLLVMDILCQSFNDEGDLLYVLVNKLQFSVLSLALDPDPRVKKRNMDPDLQYIFSIAKIHEIR